jgi:drug/metabolite transporter (DMT)-like permease
MGVVSRFAGEAGVSVLAFAAWRAILSTLLLGLVVAAMAAAARERRAGPAVSRLDRAQLLVIATFSAGASMAIFGAFERTTIAVALICFYTYPVIVAVVATRLHREPLGRDRALSLGLALGGMLLVVATPLLGEAGVRIDPLGVALGLTAAVLQAGYALIAGRGFRSLGAPAAATVINGLAAVVTVAFAVGVGAAAGLIAPLADPATWPLLLLAGTIGSAVPTVAVLVGYRRIGSTSASILMLLEPVIAVGLAALLLAEQPSALQLAGGALVLAAAAVLQVRPTPPRLVAEGPTGT